MPELEYPQLWKPMATGTRRMQKNVIPNYMLHSLSQMQQMVFLLYPKCLHRSARYCSNQGSIRVMSIFLKYKFQRIVFKPALLGQLEDVLTLHEKPFAVIVYIIEKADYRLLLDIEFMVGICWNAHPLPDVVTLNSLANPLTYFPISNHLPYFLVLSYIHTVTP